MWSTCHFFSQWYKLWSLSWFLLAGALPWGLCNLLVGWYLSPVLNFSLHHDNSNVATVVETTANVYEHFQALFEVLYPYGCCEGKISTIIIIFIIIPFLQSEKCTEYFIQYSQLPRYFIIPTLMRKVRHRMVRYSHSSANRWKLASPPGLLAFQRSRSYLLHHRFWYQPFLWWYCVHIPSLP